MGDILIFGVGLMLHRVSVKFFLKKW